MSTTQEYATMRAERDALAAQLGAVRELAEECDGQRGQCWNWLFARRLRRALGEGS